VSTFLAGGVTAFSGSVLPTAPVARAAISMDAMSDLKELATAQNPTIGYYDPLNLASWDYFSQGDEAHIGFIRHAEIKHGRVAMLAFLGYVVQSNGIKWPGMYGPWASMPDGLSPPAQWDALSLPAKLQILGLIGFLEIYSEHGFILEKQGQKHYMRGGKPGYFPKFDSLPHPVPFELYDPLGRAKNMDEATKAKRLNMEVNNGRLAMIGIFGFVAEATTPGSVPALGGLGIQHYDGEVMAPFVEFALKIPGLGA